MSIRKPGTSVEKPDTGKTPRPEGTTERHIVEKHGGQTSPAHAAPAPPKSAALPVPPASTPSDADGKKDAAK
jgi:hypothetical protein